jgi:Outer membrane protein beta-barrel domain
MKRINNAIIILITLLTIQSADAQWKVGVIGGVNFADLKTDAEVRSRTLSGFGGIIEYLIIDQFSLFAAPMYIQNGGIKEQTEDQPELDVKGSYITLPVFLKYSFLFSEVIKPYLYAGPSVAYRINFKMEGEIAGLNLTADLKNVTEDFDFGVGFGAGMEIPLQILSIIVEGKYYLGLIDLHKNGIFQAEAGGLTIQGTFDDTNKFKTRGIQILVGVTFPMGN